jgi:chromosomal replication initiation ATPase DnaA
MNYTMALDAFKRSLEHVGPVPSEQHAQKIFKFCSMLRIKADDLFIKSRKQTHVRYRSLFFYWCGLSHTDLATMFEMNHSSVIHSRRSHEDRLVWDVEYNRLFKLLYS